MSVSVAYVSQMTVGVTLEGEFVDPADATYTVNGLNTTTTLDGTTTPAVTKEASLALALSSGSITLDLTAIADANGGTVDGTGLKVQTIKLANPADNNGAITIVPGASNAYNLFGSAFSLTIPVGGEILAYLPEGTPDIASGAKEIDITGTGTDPLNIQITMG